MLANRLKLLGIPDLVGKIKFKVLCHGPLADTRKLTEDRSLDKGGMSIGQLHHFNLVSNIS